VDASDGLSQQGEHIAVNAKHIVQHTLRSANLSRDKTDWARVDSLTDQDIQQAVKDDPDAAPILDDEWFRHARLVMPERKLLISLRLDREVVDWFKRQGARYQTRINAVLKAFMLQSEKSRGAYAGEPAPQGRRSKPRAVIHRKAQR
jgi:uncharacterized protein (DUF4415 family)